MPWLQPNPGRTASEFPLTFSGGGSIPSYLLRPHNPYEQIIKTLAPAIKNYIQEKKNDAIANELMNMENPPRAEAVDQYGATYDPALARAQGLNSATDPRATPAATGGADAYKAQKLYQDYISKQQADQSQSTNEYWKNKVLEAQANKLQANADSPNDDGHLPRYPVQLPDGSTVYVTGNEAARYNRPGRAAAAAKADPWGNTIAVARGKLDEKGQFTNQYTGAENGDQVKLVTPSGNTITVPWDSYAARQRPAGAQMYQSKVQGDQPAAPDNTVAAAVPSDQTDAIARAKQAILKGANPDDVKKRLEDAGYDSTGL